MITPTLGQTVYFYLDWQVTGSGGPVTVSYRAVLDGETFCSGIWSGPAGGGWTIWCASGWTATAGTHTLRWDLDYNNTVVETNESNNSASTTWTTTNTTTATFTSTPTGTPTRTRTVTPSPTPTSGTAGPALIVDIVDASPGQRVPLGLTLFCGGAQVAGTQNTLGFDNTNVMLNLKSNGKPDCAVNPAINKGGTSFALQPPGCSGGACTGVKALVLALDNSNMIPDGSVLYTCNVNIAATASGVSTVVIGGVAMSDPNGGAIRATGMNGAVVIATPTPLRCVGDCDGSGDVQINEIIQCVSIALANASLSACTPCDANGDGQVEINEIIAAVGNALNGCAQNP